VSPRVRIIVLIMVAQTVTNVGPLGVPAIASLIRADLGLTLAQAGSFLSMYYIGPSLISLPAGTLVDRWGVKRMLVLGQVLTAVGLLFASTAHSYTAFILLLVAAGFGYGVLIPPRPRPSWRGRHPRIERRSSDSSRSACRWAACWGPRSFRSSRWRSGGARRSWPPPR
jgi:sugar phosphate permease